jgi:hypothetical protein
VLIQPFDKTSIGDIERAIMKSDVGITPGNDGNVIRLMVPQLTKERRVEMTKIASKLGEEGKVRAAPKPWVAAGVSHKIRRAAAPGCMTHDACTMHGSCRGEDAQTTQSYATHHLNLPPGPTTTPSTSTGSYPR